MAGRLRVLSVAYPFAPVSEDCVGGAEQVLRQIDKALVERGHESLVVACSGSNLHGTLVELRRFENLDAESLARGRLECRETVRELLWSKQVDLVHMHGIDFAQYLPEEPVPVLATLHLPSWWYPREIYQLQRPATYLQCVSESQRESCPECPLLVETIGNGVDIYRGRHARRNYVLAMGRICAEKNFHTAIKAAALARVPLLIAGEVFPYAEHQAYFAEQIVPSLRNGCHFLGPVGLRRKRRLLAGARCLLVPSTVAETSCLVAMEALGCGTPVVAFAVGALREIIEHGRNGFLVEDERQMAAAIHAAAALSSQDCRRTVRRRFPLRQMLESYLRLYQRIVEADHERDC